MSSNADEKLLTVDEVADLLGFHRMTVYEKVNKGEIPHIRIGRTIRFSRPAIDQWLTENAA